MPDLSTLPPFTVVIVAAGDGLRACQNVPKQFAPFCGKPLLLHSVEAFARFGAQQIVVVHPADSEALVRDLTGHISNIMLAPGGTTRQQSARNGLAALAGGGCETVLIHDAARPGVTRELVARLLWALEDAPGAIPVLPVVDSLVRGSGAAMEATIDRTGLWRVQTPQAFRLASIAAAHGAWSGPPDAGDDAQVLRAAGSGVALVEGDEGLKKVTYADDFTGAAPMMRVGTGFDVHRLADGEEMWLAGVHLDFPKGLAGHSDADVALHAITDALLGSVGAGDIGTHFPPSDPQWRGAASDAFLRHAAALVAQHGYTIGNIDLTIICEAPKIGPHRIIMRDRIASLLDLAPSAVSVKATTTEGLGFTGRDEGIAAQAVATVLKHP